MSELSYFKSALSGLRQWKQLIWNFKLLIQRYAQFIFLAKGSGIVSAPHAVNDFSRKYFPFYILLTDQISLSDCLCFVRYWGSLCFSSPGPLLSPRPWPPIYIYRPWPSTCIYRPWSLNWIYQPWPRLWPPICIYQSRSRFYYYHSYY